MQQKKQLRLFSYVGGLTVYLVLAGLFTAFTYYDQKKSHYVNIEIRLKAGVNAGLQLMPMDVHDGAFSKQPLSFDREAALSMPLGDLAQSLDLAYIYSMILVAPGEIDFVLSSPMPQEMATRKFMVSQYLEEYSEADRKLYEVWETGEPAFISYSDRWGEFASWFVPFKTPAGNTFVVGADVDIAEVNEALTDSLLKTIGFLAIIGLITLPLILVLESARRRELRLKIRSLYKDELTGLGNRQCLIRDLEQMSHPQLILLNIIRFRDISSGHGVAFGDMVLVAFGRYLKAYKHPRMNVQTSYRLHGDEFALLNDQAELPEDLDEVFSHFVHYVAGFSYKVDQERSIRLQIRAGAVLNQHADILALADMALMAAREQRRSLVIYRPAIDTSNRFHEDREHLESLRKALKENRLIPFLQPIFHCDTREVSHYEVLARILGDEGDVLLSPCQFIPIAHRYHLYYQITRTMIEQVLRRLKGHPHKVSFNLSIRDIEHPATSKFIIDTIEKSGMGSRISFELLENEAIHDVSLIRQFFVKIKSLGCRVGIDDLGKEYSNFDRLTELPIDFVKLDGGIMRFIVNDQDTFLVVKDIVNLARQKGIATVAEYIHTEEILEKAVALEVDLLQGFHLAKPSADFLADNPVKDAALVP